ncbi:smoothelin-like 1 isoform X2 [Onychostoma macrolepis]|uniref:smoothelin-like 1 isoform X2 n=1 Tax=Onychostoma macrolepis TaxID=369639 RepID=UPI00272AB67C|nr:smoothelin-like 1 isoform X2 [Onychostoma macrolepis]
MEDLENIAVTSETKDAKHVKSPETKCVAESEPGCGTDTTEGGANENNKENHKNTKTEANDSEACEQEGGVTENVNILEEKEEQEKDIKEHKSGEQEKETGVNENKECEVEEEEKKKSNNDPYRKENDSCNKEGQLEVKHKEEDKRTKETEGKTKNKEDEREKKETKDDIKNKPENLRRKSGTLRAPTKSSARPSARRDAMAKFQKDQTPGARNFKVQRTSIGMAGGASIKQKILQWCRNKTQKYEGVNIENFSSSWSDGLAFCALVHRFFPSAFNFSSLKASEREKNFTLAFSTAESLADCCPLLEVSDMLLMGNNPDSLCVFTYVQALCHHLSKIEKERREKESMEKDKNKEDQDQGVSEGNEDGEGDEIKQNEETEKNGSDSDRKTEKETDQNENVINADAVDEK